MPDVSSKSVIVERGVYYLGRCTTNEKGEKISEIPPKWEADSAGRAVIVCPVDSETREPLCAADICSASSTDLLLEYLLKALGLEKSGPDFVGILKAMNEDGIDPCQYCKAGSGVCADCALDDD